MARIKDMNEILEVEKTPIENRDLPESTYHALKRTAEKHPNIPAIKFFLQATDFKNSTSISYKEYLGKVNQTANLFNSLGIGPNDCVSYIMPNLPETYYTLFGGEAAGISGPINPLLEPHVLAEIMNASKTKVLVTIAPFPRTDLWEKVSQIANDVPTLET
ncbi:MAG: AMP-binding protein, partial [Chloroflexota bacterium]